MTIPTAGKPTSSSNRPGWTYILQCANNTYYTGSTNNLERRLQEHQSGRGANHTRKYGPVFLVYCEYHARVQRAFYREKQIQGWSQAKKAALIRGDYKALKKLAACQNSSCWEYREEEEGGSEWENQKER